MRGWLLDKACQVLGQCRGKVCFCARQHKSLAFVRISPGGSCCLSGSEWNCWAQPHCVSEGERSGPCCGSQEPLHLSGQMGGWPPLRSCVLILDPWFREGAQNVITEKDLVGMNSTPPCFADKEAGSWESGDFPSHPGNHRSRGGLLGSYFAFPLLSSFAHCLYTPRRMACFSSVDSPLSVYFWPLNHCLRKQDCPPRSAGEQTTGGDSCEQKSFLDIHWCFSYFSGIKQMPFVKHSPSSAKHSESTIL